LHQIIAILSCALYCLTFPYFKQLFVKYNIQFSGVSRSFFKISDKENHTGELGFSDLVAQIGSLSFDSTGLHWR
jgi:proteasome activator subunit 4